MVKSTQKIRRLLPTNCLRLFDHFLGLALKRLNFTFVDFVYKFHVSCMEWLNKSEQILRHTCYIEAATGGVL